LITRKQTQIAERETAILEIAGEILATGGPAALTMDNVLARVDFSKGTLYNHFTCKEDLMVAFHAQCSTDHIPYFSRGALFKGRARERFTATALGAEIKQRLNPQPSKFFITPEILEAASERWREVFTNGLQTVMGIFYGVVRDGIASGDLHEKSDPEIIACSAWALTFGSEELFSAGYIFRGLKSPKFVQIRGSMVGTLLDGYGWQPLSRDHDYEAVRTRALKEVFPEEAKKLGLLS
jgi:AcrR family transcriptional regulator